MRAVIALRLSAFVFLCLVIGCSSSPTDQEIVFPSGSFRLVGDLKLPGGKGRYPVILFVHGDGPNDRTSGGTYEPIMERMHQSGYATFAWDKPGTGESTGEIDRSRLLEQRAQIVLDAIAVLKERPEIDAQQIGLWGVSQAGYVMPMVLSRSKDVAFMIAVSCPGGPGVDQGAYLVSQQAICAGLAEDDAEEVEFLLSAVERAATYEEYLAYKEQLDAYPALADLNLLGLTMDNVPEERWHVPNLKGDYFWNPMEVIEQTTIPILAVFGEKDTQVDPIQGAAAYMAALERAGNPQSRVELFPDTDHTIVWAKTGCLRERQRRSASESRNYPPQYLDTIEEWLRELHR